MADNQADVIGEISVERECHAGVGLVVRTCCN